MPCLLILKQNIRIVCCVTSSLATIQSYGTVQFKLNTWTINNAILGWDITYVLSTNQKSNTNIIVKSYKYINQL